VIEFADVTYAMHILSLCGQTIILSSRNNLNTGNTFVDLTEQLVQSNSDNSYVPQIDVLSTLIFRLYPLDKF